MLLQMALFHSFLWLTNSPLCICATSSLSMGKVDGYLGCFHVLAIVNSATVHIGVACVFSNSSFLRIYA